jgi:hypothetical protein
MIMLYRKAIGAMSLALVLCVPIAGARAFDESKYPDFNGQWKRPQGVGNQFDSSKPQGRGQQVPLTPEYQAVFEAGLADQAAGGQGNDPTYTCIPDGMPRVMNVIFPMEIIITPNTTYMLIEYLTQQRRIYTDGRKFPEDFEPSFTGYSIGKWTDADAGGRYQTLEVETRLLKGPRSYDPSGAPLHPDNQSVVTERIYLDKADRNILHDDITTVDNALTRPWTVSKKYVRVANPIWVEASCAEGNPHVRIDGQNYMMSADGHLMPAKKGQKPPDLKYFNQPQK